jgi:hypothetical protein
MREALLTIGFILLFAGSMGAISGSTKVTDALVGERESQFIRALTGCHYNAVTGNCTLLQDLLVIEVVSTIIALVGAALILRNR